MKVSLPWLFISFLAFSCSTEPEFVRDNFSDPEATVPLLVFVEPESNSDRAQREQNSFKLQANDFASKAKPEFQLVSNLDGVFFTSKVDSSSFIDIDETVLTKGKHTLYIQIQNNITDSLFINVNMPDPLEIISAEWKAGTYQLTWSKYSGSDFISYEIYSQTGESEPELKKVISNINDTLYTDFNYPFETSFKYIIEVHSSEFSKANSTISEDIKPVILKTSQISFFQSPQNLDQLFYRNSKNDLFAYDIFTNKVDTSSIFGTRETYAYFVNDFVFPPQIVISNTLLTRTLELTNESSETALRIGSVLDLSYDPDYNIYFGSRSSGDGFDMVRLHYGEDRNYTLYREGCKFLSPRLNIVKKEIYALDIDGLCIYEYKNSDTILLKRIGVFVYGYRAEGIYQNQVSPDGKYYIGADRNHNPIIFETDEFSEALSFLDSNNIINAFHFLSGNNQILFTGWSNGFLNIYDLSTKELLSKVRFDESIVHIFEKKDQIFLLFKKTKSSGELEFIVRQLDY